MNNKLKIFTEVSSLVLSNLKNLNPLLSFHWNNFDRQDILSGLSNPLSSLTITTPEDADWFVLPMHWSYYLWNKKANIGEAIHLSKLAELHNKQLIIWFNGDLVPVVPFKNAVVFLPGIVKSKMQKNQRAAPVFIRDPIVNFEADTILQRPKKAKPSVGFCGYALNSKVKTAWGFVKGTQINILSRLGKHDYREVPFVPPTLIRARVLKLLSRYSGVETDFVIRSKYLGESKNLNDSVQSDSLVHDYFSNIYNTDYTVCLRGYGNWSYRFYETLACGRIPIFINTDCLLPLSSTIDWKKYCVWVDYSELTHIGEKVVDFHSSLSNADFIELQIASRKLWEEQFTPKGFMNHIQEYL